MKSKEFKFTEDKIIVLVSDAIDKPEFEKLLNSYKGTTSIYYVYHRLPTDEVKEFLNGFCKENNISVVGLPDMHQKGKSKLFHLIGEFCQATSILNEASFEDLKKKFKYDEILERKLTLLHECLHHESATKADISWLAKEQQELVEKLIKINDNMDENYIRILTQLRKDLLGS